MMKKYLGALLALVLVFNFGAPAMAYEVPLERFQVYSEECPEEVQEYARDNYYRFLVASVESGAFQAGNNIALGSPITISSQQLKTVVYYFPIISDGTIVATFRIGKDPETNCYTGVMSKFLADELDSLSKNTTNTAPVFLFATENYGIMATTENETYVLVEGHESMSETAHVQVADSLKIVEPLSPIANTSLEMLASPYGTSKYITLDITETQTNQEWCFAFAAATIIRTLTDATPTALSIMALCRETFDESTELDLTDVRYVAGLFGLSPKIQLSTISPYSEIDNGRPIFLRTQDVTNSKSNIADSGGDLSGGGKSFHALVMRGYNKSTNIYSIWNPWDKYYESMDASTNIYVAKSGESFKWINTVHNW